MARLSCKVPIRCHTGKIRYVSVAATRDRVRKLRGRHRDMFYDSLAVERCSEEEMFMSFARWRDTPEAKETVKKMVKSHVRGSH